jgi:hypothetical protein
VHQLKADDFILSPLDIAKPPMREIPDLISLMLEAIWDEPKGDRTVVKKFVARFEGRVMPTSGFKIGKKLAGHMATVCRATIIATGGNRYQSNS